MPITLTPREAVNMIEYTLGFELSPGLRKCLEKEILNHLRNDNSKVEVGEKQVDKN